ncbi:MAG TPA: hypothetical protein PK765_07525 [bacterium]|nr:hypothetical protein [bacterium]
MLPHGDSDQTDNSSMGASAQSEAVSGFAGEIDLNAVGRIKSDTSKKIVVQDLRPGDQQRFSGAYWR